MSGFFARHSSGETSCSQELFKANCDRCCKLVGFGRTLYSSKELPKLRLKLAKAPHPCQDELGCRTFREKRMVRQIGDFYPQRVRNPHPRNIGRREMLVQELYVGIHCQPLAEIPRSFISLPCP